MEKVFAVIGLGAFGVQLCLTLMEKGGKVIAIDSNPDLVDMMKDKVTSAVLLDASDDQALSHAALDNIDYAIVAISDNIEANILSTAILKQIPVPFVLSRAVSEIHEKVLKQIGADEVINLEVDEGERIASRLIAPDILDRVPISAELTIAEAYMPKEFQGGKVTELGLMEKFNLSLVIIKRITTDVDEDGVPKKKEIVIYPQDNAVLEKNDILVVLGKNSDIDNFMKAGE